MSIKNLDNLDEAINSISAGLQSEIIVSTLGTNVYAKKSSTRIDGVKSGDNYIISGVTTGTWTVYATLGGSQKSATVKVQKTARYNITVGIATLTETYWKWNSYSISGTSRTYNINFTSKNSLSFSSLVAPFKSNGWTTGSSRLDVLYYGTNGTYYIGYTSKSTLAGGGWGYVELIRDGADLYISDVRNADCQFFKITGGSDVTNSTLVTLLLQNATQCDSNWNPLK